jgi:hypothetical protein
MEECVWMHPFPAKVNRVMTGIITKFKLDLCIVVKNYCEINFK